MTIYRGISKDDLFLLADNRFRNSKEFYDEHKEYFKQNITVPMRQIAEIIGSELYSLDPQMNLIPTKMVSRIRRDTRYTHDKHLYRDNMWIMFMRDKHQWINYPCFWFEIEQTGYSMGIGFFGTQTGLMETFRKKIRESPDEFKAAAALCLDTGTELYGQTYKKPREGCPEGLEDYYNRKDFGFIKHGYDFNELEDDTIIKIISKTFRSLSPMYSFLLSVSDEYFSKGE